MNKKILVIGIHGPYEPWLTILRDGQVKTWMSTKTPIRIINVFGKRIGSKAQKTDQRIYFLRWSPRKSIAYSSLAIEALVKKMLTITKYKPQVFTRNDKDLHEIWNVAAPDYLILQGVKNMAVFRESLKYEYDFLVTTITSTYLNLNLLEEVLDEIEPVNFAGGRIENSGSLSYQQGSFRIYSRDVVSNLVQNSNKYRHWNIEDIAMGKLVSRMGYKLTEVKNLTIGTLNDVDLLEEEALKTTISYRCKSIENGKRNDATIMEALHGRLRKV